MLNIVWFKRDLRIENHTALAKAMHQGPILALYCWEPSQWLADDASLSQQAFIGECLRSLRQSLQTLQIPLQISSLGIIATLNAVLAEQKIASIHSHEETGNLNSYRVDQSVAQWCHTYNVDWHEYQQHGVIRGLKNRNQWQAKWEEHMRAPIVTLPSSTTQNPIITLPKQTIVRARGDDKPARQSGGRKQALLVLDSFLSQRVNRYYGGISSPINASEASSRLSPYLAAGCISMREVVQACRARRTQCLDEGLTPKHAIILGLRSFESRLHWHCHFMQKLESEPTLEIQHMHSAHIGIRDETLNDIESQRRLNAWCKGETGWPLVDACLAMLAQTGWINFRMRAMLMSSASYLLWLHWRETGLHLAREFVDYEPGIHWPQVQMQSGSTGINTLRIYNPVKQARDQDPRGRFVRHWIPALRRVPDIWLFEPHLMPANLQLQYGCVLEKDYPLPLVDIQLAMRHAKSEIALARKRHLNRYETQEVLRQHGSRSTSRRRVKPKKTSSAQQSSLF